jgi:hypothetical protein
MHLLPYPSRHQATSGLSSLFRQITIAVLALGTTVAFAQVSIPIVNGSFEAGPGYFGGSGASAVPGWTNGGQGNSSFGWVDDLTGIELAGMDGVHAARVNGQLFQQTSATFLAGYTYTLTFLLGTYQATPTNGFGVQFRTAIPGTNNAAANTFIADDLIPRNSMAVFTASYTATAAEAGLPIVIRFNDFFGNNVYVDNVSLSAIPEPSTVATIMGMLALAGAIGWRRWRGRRQA